MDFFKCPTLRRKINVYNDDEFDEEDGNADEGADGPEGTFRLNLSSTKRDVSSDHSKGAVSILSLIEN